MTARKKPLGRRIVANFGKKWVQVIISILALALVIVGARQLLVKPPPKSDTEKAKAAAEFKFMHCDKCMREMPYNKDLEGKPAYGGCKCAKREEGGYWVGTKESVVGGGGDPSERWFYTAVLVASVLWLGVLWFLLARKDDTPDRFFIRCLHCREMLRYTSDGFDKLVACPTCEQPIRLPDEDEAMSDEDHQDEVTDTTLGEYEAKLRATGYVFPHERPEPEEPTADGEVPTDQPDPNSPDAPR